MIKLNTIDADTLMSTPLPATRFIVEDLLPEGLHILAGSFKSRMTLQTYYTSRICLAVSVMDWKIKSYRFSQNTRTPISLLSTPCKRFGTLFRILTPMQTTIVISPC